MLKIAITGGIGAGKSSVLRILSEKGFKVLKADDIAKTVYRDKSFLKEIEKIGILSDIFSDKKKIEEIVFGERREDFLKILYKYTKALRKKVFSDAEKKGETFFFYESSLIFEAKTQDEFDFIALVYAPEGLRRERILKSRKISFEKLEKILKNQIPDEKKLSMVDYVILNKSGLDELSLEVEKFIKTLHQF